MSAPVLRDAARVVIDTRRPPRAPPGTAVTLAQVFKEHWADLPSSWRGRSRTFIGGVRDRLATFAHAIRVRSEGIEPIDDRVRAGCLTFKLRALTWDAWESNPSPSG